MEKISNSHFENIPVRDAYSLEKSWQNATHTAFGNEWGPIMRITHFILMFFFLSAVQTVEVMADENAEYDVYQENLLKEVLDEDRRISSQAMFNLGFSYLPGNGPQDYIRAYMWFSISAGRYKADGE